MTPAPEESGLVLIFAPIGRDAAACASLVVPIGLEPEICSTIQELVERLVAGADIVLLTEETLFGKGAEPLADWVLNQPPWSDQPFIVLTSRNETPRFTAFRRDLVTKLRNVAFLERPVQAVALQAALLGARRARCRQYEARDYLAIQRGAAAKLEHLIRQRTEALEQANAQLRAEIDQRERAQIELLQAQKLETMGQLVGGVAHDFNNLLMVIIGNLELLAKDSTNNPRQIRLINGAMEGARRGATLTQRLLAFAHRQELRTQATDVIALVEDMRELMSRSLGPVIELNIEAGNGLPCISVDPNQLEMALLNLAVNARDAMPSGGRVTIALKERTITTHESDLAAGQYVSLSVRDTGMGMDADTLAKAVEPFFSTKGVGKGTGLGLSMVHGLAQQSGGAFRLNSRLGGGTEAELWFPVAKEAVEIKTVTLPALTEAPPSTILLVDDDALVAASTKALLEDLGHQVVEVHSGAEALTIIEQGLQPDLVITDYAMPAMTGTGLAVQLRHRDPCLPILLASGYAELKGDQPLDLPRLAKPFTRSELSSEISRMLSERHPA